MQIENYQFPKSSFLSIEKDTALIVKQILKNDRLQKLLYYNTKDALFRPDLTQEQTLDIVENKIKILPKIQIDNDVLVYLVITFDNFKPSTNPEFRDNDIIFDIVCNYDQWLLNDFQQRPFKIAGELDYMFNDKKLTGIGTLNFVNANQMLLSDNCGVLSLTYHAYHGGEDQVNIPNPRERQDFIANFDEMYNK